MFNLFFSLFLISIVHFTPCKGRDDDIQFIADNNHNFDLLIFTQRWPVTGCMEWMEKSHSHSCALPSPKEIWTIHGVWPTRFGTIGPAFCNSSAEFDLDALKPFEDQLQQFWINIEKGTPLEQLWKHEWLKHGTCAAQLDELNNENKYFGQGLSWLQQYSMSSVLQKGGIVPDKSYTLISIHKAVVSVLNKNPSIHCIHDRKRDEIFLDEIRICFNKSLMLVDCDGVVDDSEVLIDYPGGKVITNCDLSKTILYPSIVPPSHRPEKKENEWKFPFVNIYKLFEMIKWATFTPKADIDFIADKNHDFDFIIFTQQWPIAACMLLMEQNKKHECATSGYPKQEHWTIHGVWPTRIGSKSPAFCNKWSSFDEGQLEPFKSELKEFWVNVKNNTRLGLFWKQEWMKHGTCFATQISELNSEEKYFLQGLKWMRIFDMTRILESVGIIPGGTYKIVDVHNSLYSKLTKIASIHCIRSNMGDNYLSEIRLCLSKSLELIDCHVTGNVEVVYKSSLTNMPLITNCNLHKDILYPNLLPHVDVDDAIPVKRWNWSQLIFRKIVDFVKHSLL